MVMTEPAGNANTERTPGRGRSGGGHRVARAPHEARWAAGVSLAVSLLLVAPSASAQHFEQGVRDPRIISPAGLGPSYTGLTGSGVGLVSKKPSFGIEAGDFIIQPRLFLEGSYRTNFFRSDPRAGDPQGVMSLHVRPGLALFNPQFDLVAVSLGLDADIFVPLSGDERVTDKTTAGGVARLAVALFPRSALTLTLHEEFDRTIWMRPQLNLNANRNRNRVGADLSFHPGGRALDFTLGYTYELTRYDDLTDLNIDAHILRFLASWRFYPMTYAFLESSVRLFAYSREASEEEQARPGNFVPGTPLKVYAGLSGYITERLAVLIRAGYGNTFLERDPEDFSSFIGQLQVSYRISPKAVLHAGAARDFDLAPFGGYKEFFRAYASFTQRIGELAEVSVDLAYDVRTYGEWVPSARAGLVPVDPVASDPQRSENFVRAGIMLDFDLTRLLGATLGYRYEALVSDFTISTGEFVSFVGFDDHRIYASLNLRY